MLIEVRVPPFAESISEGTLSGWRKQPGEAVTEGDNLVEIETDKVILDVPAPNSGVLKKINKENNAIVFSEEVIALIDTDAGKKVEPKEKRTSVAGSKAPQLGPAVRKLLDQHQLNPAQIPAAKGGRVTKADVLKYLDTRVEKPVVPTQPQASEESTPSDHSAMNRLQRRVPMTRIRKRVAERLLSAQHEHAILTTFNEVNMQPVMELRKQYRDKFEEHHKARLGFMSFFVLAAVDALKRFPEINASIDGDDIVYHGYFDIGIAVSSPRGLVVPILRDTERMNIAGIESAIASFGQKAKESKLTIEDLTGGTFTISNGGVFGSLLSTPILNPPQSAILGMHKIQERPIAENGSIVIRPMMYLALSYDHRLVDGREAVQFLVAIKEKIEDPSRLLLQV